MADNSKIEWLFGISARQLVYPTFLSSGGSGQQQAKNGNLTPLASCNYWLPPVQVRFP